MPEELRGGEQTQLASPLPTEFPKGKKTDLALAIALGKSVAAVSGSTSRPTAIRKKT